MEEVSPINVAPPEPIPFDSVELLGLIVPVLFAIFTIVLVALSPAPASTIEPSADDGAGRIEQIHRR